MRTAKRFRDAAALRNEVVEEVPFTEALERIGGPRAAMLWDRDCPDLPPPEPDGIPMTVGFAVWRNEQVGRGVVWWGRASRGTPCWHRWVFDGERWVQTLLDPVDVR